MKEYFSIDYLNKVGREMAVISPLRYPGSKRRLVPYLRSVLKHHNIKPRLLVEPFAGGASVSISLLEDGDVEEVALSDLNILVSSFWRIVFSSEAIHLADAALDMKLDIETYKSIKCSNPESDFERAKKCLYLNRTNFSGILHDKAGPIGGWSQDKYKLDCRFPREWLAKRIEDLSKLRERVRFVRTQSYRKTIQQIQRASRSLSVKDEVFWYLDPPFFNKAKTLYQNSFDVYDHRTLASDVDGITGNWVLSYDDVGETRNYYSGKPGLCVVEFAYSAKRAGHSRVTSREALVSNLPVLPALEPSSSSRTRQPLLVYRGWQDTPASDDSEFEPAFTNEIRA